MVLELNMEDTARFLKLLDPEAASFTFQVYPDKSRKKILSPVAPVHLPFSDVADDLTLLNSNGYYISVNINETNGSGRTAKDITRVRAIWIDDDTGAFKGEYPLLPSLSVETSEGRYHRYWFLSDDMSFETFSGIMTRLVQDYGHDPRACGRQQVMRLPGFIHNDKVFVSRIVGDNDLRYTAAEIETAFPLIAKKPRKAVEVRESGEVSEDWQRDKGRVASALRFLAGMGFAEDRRKWFGYGKGIWDDSGGSDQALWDEFANTCEEKYDQDIQDEYWNYEFDNGEDYGVGLILQDAFDNGWTAETVIKIRANLPEDALKYVKLGPIGTQAIANLRTKFNSKDYNHFPSDDHWVGLECIAKIIEEQANSRLTDLYYMSSLPAGMGKTQTLIETVKCLLADDEYKHVGVIIFLFRLEEIKKVVEDMKLDKKDFSVFTSDDKYNNLGNSNPTQARVMFTTQKMLETRSKDSRLFAKMSEFYYNSKPRQVRVWDEAILPSRIFTLQRKKIFGLLETLTDERKALADELLDFTLKLDKCNDRDTIDVPDFDRHGVSKEDVKTWFDYQDQQDTVEVLFWFSGRPVVVRKDDYGNAFLDYEDILPTDLAPMLILDASGSQRETYRFWYQDRGNLHPLKSPPKNFKGLTIHYWNKGSGKDTWKKDWKVLREGIVKAINDDIPQDEEVLVVYRSPKKRETDISDLIKALLPSNQTRVKFITWGQHTATNEFQTIKHVILASLHQLPVSANEATGRAAKGMKTEEMLSEEDYQNTRLGEIRQHVLQAVNRGYVRKALGDSCPYGCHLYTIFPKQNVPQEQLNIIFPGATIVDWIPVTPKLKKEHQLIVDYIVQKAKRGTKTINKKLMADKFNITHLPSLNRILYRDDVIAALKTKGITYQVTAKEIVLN